MTEQQAETIIALLGWIKTILIIIAFNLYMWFLLFCLREPSWRTFRERFK